LFTRITAGRWYVNLPSPHVQTIARESLPTSEEELKSAATTTPSGVVRKASKFSPDFGCICDWNQCSFISRQFFHDGYDGYPWKGPSLSWTASTSKNVVILVKNQVFCAGVFWSLNIPKEEHKNY
jgi:hypothetical protein